MIRRRRANRCCCLLVGGLMTSQGMALEEKVDADFLEFLGSMVESEGELVGPLDLYDTEIMGTQGVALGTAEAVVSQDKEIELKP